MINEAKMKSETAFNGATTQHGYGYSVGGIGTALSYIRFAYVLAGETERFFPFLFLAALSAMKHCPAHCRFLIHKLVS